MPKASAIITTYERTNQLADAVQSVLNQNFNSLELIVVDANDKEEYSKKVEEIIGRKRKKSDVPIQLIKNEESSGVSSDRNKGVKSAEGEYIAFLDDDDKWKPSKIEKTINFISKENFQAIFSAAEMYRDDTKIDTVRYGRKEVSLSDILSANVIGSPSQVVLKKENYDEVGGFAEDFDEAEDWELWIRLIKNGCSFGYLDLPLIEYDVSEDSKSNDVEKATEGRDKVTRKFADIIEGESVVAEHYLNRAKKQYELKDLESSKTFLRKSLSVDSRNIQAYFFYFSCMVRQMTGINLVSFLVRIRRIWRR